MRGRGKSQGITRGASVACERGKRRASCGATVLAAVHFTQASIALAAQRHDESMLLKDAQDTNTGTTSKTRANCDITSCTRIAGASTSRRMLSDHCCTRARVGECQRYRIADPCAAADRTCVAETLEVAV
jgi:hypothetical protein